MTAVWDGCGTFGRWGLTEKWVVGGGPWGLWSCLNIVHSLLLGLMYMETSLTVSDHHGWGHTHHHAFPAVLVNFLVAVTKYPQTQGKRGAYPGLQFEGTAHRRQQGMDTRMWGSCLIASRVKKEEERDREERETERQRQTATQRQRDSGWSVGPQLAFSLAFSTEHQAREWCLLHLGWTFPSH